MRKVTNKQNKIVKFKHLYIRFTDTTKKCTDKKIFLNITSTFKAKQL